MTADMKAAAAGLTRCDLCGLYVLDLPAHGVLEHLGSWVPLRHVQSGDTILLNDSRVVVSRVESAPGITIVHDEWARQYPCMTGVDGPVRVIEVADPDSLRKTERDENSNWDEWD